MEPRPQLFDALGEGRLRAVIGDFYDRVFADLMIGFFFRGQDRQRLVELEVQLIGQVLGGPMTYAGRPLRTAHAGHRIFDGHFARRRQILVETLDDHGIEGEVRQVWLRHTDGLKAQVVAAGSESCMNSDPVSGTERE